MITLHRVVITRQKYKRHSKGRPLAKPLRMFPGITFKDVDLDIPHCLKYLLNFGFYRFGVEVIHYYLALSLLHTHTHTHTHNVYYLFIYHILSEITDWE